MKTGEGARERGGEDASEAGGPAAGAVVGSPRGHQAAVRRLLWVVLFLNLGVSAAKLVAGGWARSLGMVADGFHSLTDGAANVVALVGLAIAARPPDADHPYGHSRFETLTALAIGGLLALTAWEVLESCFDRLRHGGGPEVTSLAFAVMLVSLTVTAWVAWFERRRAKELRSPVLAADAAHTAADVWVSLGVIASLGAARLGWALADVVAAVLITGAIARAAFGILRENAGLLADSALLDPHRVAAIARSVPGVEGVHKIRSRGSVSSGHCDLHVQLRPDLRLDRAHAIGHQVADRLRQELGVADVVVHVEPPVGHLASEPEAAAGGRSSGGRRLQPSTPGTAQPAGQQEDAEHDDRAG